MAGRSRRRTKPIPRREQQRHPCLCGYMCEWRPMMVVHHRTCTTWLERPNPRGLSQYRRKKTCERQRAMGLGHSNELSIERALGDSGFTRVELSDLLQFLNFDDGVD